MNLEPLHLGVRVPHTTAAITGNSTAQDKRSQAAADYVSSGTPATSTIDMNGANTPCPRYALVGNLDASIVIYVNAGNDNEVPPAATTCSTPVFPGSSEYFEIPGGSVKGIGAALSIKAASATPSYSLVWIF